MAKKVLMLVFLVLVFVGNCYGGISSLMGGAMAVPTRHQIFDIPLATMPLSKSDPSEAVPLGLGAIASNGYDVSLRIETGPFTGPVDMYLGIGAEDLYPGFIFIVHPDGSLKPLTEGFVPWRAGVSDSVSEWLYGRVPAALFPLGEYDIYLAVTPAGSTGSYYLWHTAFSVTPNNAINVSAGNIITIAGGGVGDGGPATAAFLNPPGVAVDTQGNIFIADNENARIRKVDALTGVIITVAGNGAVGYSGDGGPATAARLQPAGVALDGQGNIYIADGSNRIRKVDALTGVITTVAGNGAYGYAGDGGPATVASIQPTGVALDGQGNIYIADIGNLRIRKVDALTGIITTVAGNGTWSNLGDGSPAIAASIEPAGVALDGQGNIYIADAGNNRIRKVDALTGIITTVAGNGAYGYSGDGGPATAASLGPPAGVTMDGQGNIYIADVWNNRIRKVDALTEIITTVAGNGSNGYSGDGGPATGATLLPGAGVIFDGQGDIYIADTYNARIRKVDALTGIITTVAGNGVFGYSGDGGPATVASFNYPQAVAIDGQGNVYIADAGNNRIRKVDALTGIISTVAGNGSNGYSGDGGPAIAASLYGPQAVAIDGQGNMYIADAGNNRIRKVDALTGIISTVAGNGSNGYSGDGGPAIAASFYYPQGVAVDGQDSIYIVDAGNNRIRRVDALTGIITTVAGNGAADYSGDGGPAIEASINPAEVGVDGQGNIFIADFGNNRIRKVDALMGIITTVAGNGIKGYSGDGDPATEASLNGPQAVAVDGQGNVFITDAGNNRVRMVVAVK